MGIHPLCPCLELVLLCGAALTVLYKRYFREEQARERVRGGEEVTS